MRLRLPAAVVIGLSCLACGQQRAVSGPTPSVAKSDSGGNGERRSSGCGKAPAAVGGRRLPIAGRTGLFVVSLPSGYDPARAYPLVFALHGRNRNHLDCQRTDCAGIQSVMGEHAILVYPQSLREPLDQEKSGWEWPSEREDNVRFFAALLAQSEAEYCVDESRVFVVGTSSGGTFANLLACRYGDRLRAISAVSGGFLGAESCVGSPAALLLHGIDDPHVPIARGELARASFLERSRCGPSSVPLSAEMHAAVRQARDAAPPIETASCVDYQGCAPSSPVRWCEHSYGGYDGSTHGWPPVGGQLIWDFVSRL
jgi:polyhydroxybutyrate depolymerase